MPVLFLQVPWVAMVFKMDRKCRKIQLFLCLTGGEIDDLVQVFNLWNSNNLQVCSWLSATSSCVLKTTMTVWWSGRGTWLSVWETSNRHRLAAPDIVTLPLPILIIFDKVVGPLRLVLGKKAFRSGLYAPWRGAYCYGNIFFLKSVIWETP